MSAPIGGPFDQNMSIPVGLTAAAITLAQTNRSGYDEVEGPRANLTHTGQPYIIVEGYSWIELFAFFGTYAVDITDTDVQALIDAGGHQEIIDILANGDVAGGTMLVRESTNSRFFNMLFTVTP